MDDRGGSFVAVRRISQGLDRSNTCHSSSGSTAWLGRGLSCVCAQRRESDARPSFDLTPAQEECLQRLQNRIDIPYDGSIPEHQDALRALWSAAFPEEELHGLISEQWKNMGWQGKDPSTDFRNLFKTFYGSRKEIGQCGNIHLLLLVLTSHSCLFRCWILKQSNLGHWWEQLS
uniref:ELMO domain-containing protein n=1 Tax=Glycine max TaxID=3847 RepID=A0A0R0F3T8_SOYBN